MAIRASAPFWAACKPGSMQAIQLSRKTMKILSIDHVQIAMPTGEEEKARGFYIGLLGFSEIPKPPELAKRGGAWFQSENVQLHLGVEADFKPARKAHPALLVDDLDSLITKVQTSGYETDTSQPPLDGYKRAHVFDPFGNRIELMEKI
jgi:catechol 2,3-dioxygenase-like lactoylglutathione lyase family enzyme